MKDGRYLHKCIYSILDDKETFIISVCHCSVFDQLCDGAG